VRRGLAVSALVIWGGCIGTSLAGPLPAARFRFTDLDLRDPHLFISFLGCRDVTDTLLADFSFNSRIQNAIQGDQDGDGLLDTSYLIEFLPLDQSAATNPMAFGSAQCTAPPENTSCGALMAPQAATATLSPESTCLAAVADTLRPYTPSVVTPTPPCFASSNLTITVSLGGVPLTLTDAQVGATFVGNPAASLANGLIRGFIPETAANATVFPESFALLGGSPLSATLPGGADNCAAHDDRDVHNGVIGWWFYFNFPAQAVQPAPNEIFANGFEDPPD